MFLNRLRREGREVSQGDALQEEEHDSATLEAASAGVVVLADLEGLSYREIAEVVGCPLGTVMSRLSRGRRLLRASLAGFAREHGYLRGPA